MQTYMMNGDGNKCKPRQILIILSQIQDMMSYSFIMMKCIQRMGNRNMKLYFYLSKSEKRTTILIWEKNVSKLN